MMKLYIIGAIFLTLITACTHKQSSDATNSNDVNFKEKVSLTADSAAIDVVIKPGNIYRADPYIIVSDASESVDNHFAVFDKDLKYLYSFCRYGQGADECIMPTVAKNMPAGQFLVRDHANNRYYRYELSDSGAVMTESFRVPDMNDYESLWEINHLHDNVYAVKGVAPKKAVRRIMDFAKGYALDSIPPTFDLPSIMGRDYYTEFDDCWLVSNGERFACAYYFIDCIEFGRIDNDRMIVEKKVGCDTPPEFHRFTDEVLTGKYKYNVDYNIVYYEWLFCTDKTVYASYFGEPWGDIKNHSSRILSYSVDGSAEIEYSINVPLSSFIVLEDTGRIIGVNADRSDDSFYVYDYN